MRHCLPLLGILLGLGTLAASQVFRASRVIAVMSAVSGVLVIGMGATTIWRSGRLGRRGGRTTHAHRDRGRVLLLGHEELVDDRGELSQNQIHPRLHVEKAMALRGTRRRSLLTLGVSGGLAPYPDALGWQRLDRTWPRDLAGRPTRVSPRWLVQPAARGPLLSGAIVLVFGLELV